MNRRVFIVNRIDKHITNKTTNWLLRKLVRDEHFDLVVTKTRGN